MTFGSYPSFQIKTLGKEQRGCMLGVLELMLPI